MASNGQRWANFIGKVKPPMSVPANTINPIPTGVASGMARSLAEKYVDIHVLERIGISLVRFKSRLEHPLVIHFHERLRVRSMCQDCKQQHD
jgi:hypothetical protein